MADDPSTPPILNRIADSSTPTSTSGTKDIPVESAPFFSRTRWLGDYDYKALCMPRVPCLPTTMRNGAIFFGLDDPLPIFLAAIMGFQHALAMVGGVIAVPRILAGAGNGHLNLAPPQQAYLISAALIISGLMSIIQIVRIRLFKGYYIGTGLISMSGTSFVFLPIAESAISFMVAEGICRPEQPCPEAYGRWLGTVMVGALVEIALSFVRPKALRKLFPPIVTGVTVFLIGASLVGTGLKFWAGGAGPCYQQKLIEALGAKPTSDFFSKCPNSFAPKAFPWGHARWIGLGFFVFSIIILIEFFGSPFMRNTQIMIGLIAGIILSAATGYLDQGIIKAAPAITFLWTTTFPLGFYAPAILPVLIGHVISTVETVGDISASCDASRVATSGPEFESRVQGGLLADGVNSLIAGLMTGNPTTTFSQNNAVIAMTRTATQSAGLWACFWLILMGVIGKIGGAFVAIPDAALGGMTVFLFANVTVAGLRILADLKWDRRDRFILSISLAIGLGVILVPKAFEFFIPQSNNTTVESLRKGLLIILGTGYSIGSVLAVFLNLLLPEEEEARTAGEILAEQRALLRVADTEDTLHVGDTPKDSTIPSETEESNLEAGKP